MTISINKTFLRDITIYTLYEKIISKGRMTRIGLNSYLNEVGASYGVQFTNKVAAADGVEVPYEVASAQRVQVPLDKVRPAELVKVLLNKVAASDGVQVPHKIPSTNRVQVTNKVTAAEGIDESGVKPLLSFNVSAHEGGAPDAVQVSIVNLSACEG